MELASRADRFTEARVQADQALKASSWTSLKIAGTVTFVCFAGLGTALQGLGSVGQGTSLTGWLFLSLAVPVGLLVFGVLEFKRIWDRAAALRTLYDAQREYESLLADARDERDVEHGRAEALLKENEVIRTTAHMVRLFRTAVKEQSDE